VSAGVPVLEVLQPEDGGVAEHVLRLATGLHERGWAVEVATPAASTIAGPLRDTGVPVHDLEMVRRPGLRDLAAARALREIDRRGGYRLVHGHSSKAGALVRAVLPRRRRLIYTPHCFAFATGMGGAQRLLYQALEQAVVPRSGAVIAVCDWERDLALRRLRLIRGRLARIENGVESCPTADPDPRLLELRDGRPLAGMVTALRAQKDPLLAVRAMARLAARGDVPGRLAIVGSGPLEGEVRQEIDRLDLGEHVAWVPYGGSVTPYLRALDVFVLSSAWEALPLSVLEAMSCGLPVVSTAVGGVPDAVEDSVTGRLVPHGDEEALGSAIGELLHHADLRRDLGAAGRREFERRFRVDLMLDRTEELYRDRLAAADGGPPGSHGNGRRRRN
jgi:glycosyltransferase involved in cell wall biosynthesis